MGFAAREARIANEFSSDMVGASTDYAMSAGDTVVIANPETAFIEITLPAINEAIGQIYSISNVNAVGNVVRVVDRDDSMRFEVLDDLPNNGTYILYSNGLQWFLLFSNVPMVP